MLMFQWGKTTEHEAHPHFEVLWSQYPVKQSESAEQFVPYRPDNEVDSDASVLATVVDMAVVVVWSVVVCTAVVVVTGALAHSP